MSAKENKALMRRDIEEWNKGKAAAMTAIDMSHATDCVAHSGSGADIRGLKELKEYVSMVFNAFPRPSHNH